VKLEKLGEAQKKAQESANVAAQSQSQFAGAPKAGLSGIKEISIVSGEEAYTEKIFVKVRGNLEVFFGGNGFPMNTFMIFLGCPNQGKSFLAAAIGADIARSDVGKYGKVLYIETEPESIDGSADYEKNKTLFDFVRPSNLGELASFVQKKLPNLAGITHSFIAIDSISEPAEDSQYLPDNPADMGAYRERAKYIRIIKETIRELLVEANDGKRKPFSIIMTSHLTKIVRPDIVPEDSVIDPFYGKSKGQVQLISGYMLSGSTSVVLQYLASYIFIFKDASYTTQKSVMFDKDKNTVVKVSAWKSRRSSKFVETSFRITNDGVC